MLKKKYKSNLSLKKKYNENLFQKMCLEPKCRYLYSNKKGCFKFSISKEEINSRYRVTYSDRIEVTLTFDNYCKYSIVNKTVTINS
jgi:hypothetical protein